MHLLLNLFASLTMAAAAAGNLILLLYRRSKLVSRVTGKLAGLVVLFSMARSLGDLVGAARILTLLLQSSQDSAAEKYKCSTSISGYALELAKDNLTMVTALSDEAKETYLAMELVIK